MSRRVYFIIQIFWSFIYSAIMWFAFMYNTTVNPVESGNNTLSYIILFGGPALYLVLTIIYIIIGTKKVDDWAGWMIAVSIVINIVMGFLGFFGATASSSFLVKWFGMEPFYGLESIV